MDIPLIFKLFFYREGKLRSTLKTLYINRVMIITDALSCRKSAIKGGNHFLVPTQDAVLANPMEKFINYLQLIAQPSHQLAHEIYEVRNLIIGKQ